VHREGHVRGRPAGSAAWRAFRQCVDDVRELKGRRIAVGGPESGTRSLAATLLGATAADVGTDLLPLERDAAIEQLKKGEIDSVFLVAPAEAPSIKKTAVAPGVRLLSFAGADAYVRRFPYFSKLVLPRGVFDLVADVPARDVDVVRRRILRRLVEEPAAWGKASAEKRLG
jgi:TRAP-type uncharacterized transport system substrate-binding protein